MVGWCCCTGSFYDGFAKHCGIYHHNQSTYATPMASLGSKHADFQTAWQSLVHSGRGHTDALVQTLFAYNPVISTPKQMMPYIYNQFK